MSAAERTRSDMSVKDMLSQTKNDGNKIRVDKKRAGKSLMTHKPS